MKFHTSLSVGLFWSLFLLMAEVLIMSNGRNFLTLYDGVVTLIAFRESLSLIRQASTLLD